MMSYTHTQYTHTHTHTLAGGSEKEEQMTTSLIIENSRQILEDGQSHCRFLSVGGEGTLCQGQGSSRALTRHPGGERREKGAHTLPRD